MAPQQRHLFRVTAIVDERHHWTLLMHLTEIKAMNVESLPVGDPTPLPLPANEAPTPKTRRSKTPPQAADAASKKNGTATDRVLAVLAAIGKPMGAQDIRKHLRTVPIPTIHVVLSKLYNDAKLRRVGKGVYELIDGPPAPGAMNGATAQAQPGKKNAEAHAMLLSVIGKAGAEGIDKAGILKAFEREGQRATTNSIGWLLRENDAKLTRLKRGVYALKPEAHA